MTRITIDPITRIEEHLRIDCEVENGKVDNKRRPIVRVKAR